MIKEIRHTGLVVNNLDYSLWFWRDLLGFKVMRRMDESGHHVDAMIGLKCVDLTTVKLIAPGGGVLELLHFKSHPSSEGWNGEPFSTGFTHLALTVANLDLLYARLCKEGFTFSGVPQLSMDGAVKVIYCRGPEGVLLEFVEELSST